MKKIKTLTTFLSALLLVSCANNTQSNPQQEGDEDISVSSITLNESNKTIKVNEKFQLIATVSPTNATNQNITWSSSDNDVAYVSTTGEVTGISEGNATVTATSASDKSITASCKFTVTQNSSDKPEAKDSAFSIVFASASEDSNREITSLSDNIETGKEYISNYEATKVYASTNGLKISSSKVSGSLTIYLKEKYVIKSVVAKAAAYNSKDNSKLEINGVSQSLNVNMADYTYTFDNVETDEIALSAIKRVYLKSLTFTVGAIEPVDPAAITLSSSSLNIKQGKTAKLIVGYLPSNANQNKEITWTSSNTSIATVNNGEISVNSDAPVNSKVTITAKLTNLPSISASCEVTVEENVIISSEGSYTIMIYLCGSDLESGELYDDYGNSTGELQGLATLDIKEILSVKNQPDDVNILIQTGGASAWKDTYGIPNDKLGRWEVRNGKLNKVEFLNNASMGSQDTLESFLTWGLSSKYRADHTAVIFWNHGGALDGCCYDENFSGTDGYSDSLSDLEISNAFKNVRNNLNITEKFDWIGYDCCLMQVQDIAEFNSQYFKYMVASQESEAGEGWAYSEWLDDLYAKKDLDTILTAICDSFVKSYEDTYGVAGYDNDQTLSYLDLSYMASYKTAFESFATKVKNIGLSKLKALLKNVKDYADEYCTKDDYNYYVDEYNYPTGMFVNVGSGYYLLPGYHFYGSFDVIDMLNKMNASNDYSTLKNDIDNLKSILSDVIVYNKTGDEAGNSNGLCVIANISDYNDIGYSNSYTNFKNWRAIF